jgi:hypothetical protein
MLSFRVLSLSLLKLIVEEIAEINMGDSSQQAESKVWRLWENGLRHEIRIKQKKKKLQVSSLMSEDELYS